MWTQAYPQSIGRTHIVGGVLPRLAGRVLVAVAGVLDQLLLGPFISYPGAVPANGRPG